MKKATTLLLAGLCASAFCYSQTTTGTPPVAQTNERTTNTNLLTPFMQLGKYGFVDVKGTVIIPCVYDKVLDFKEGFAVVGTYPGASVLSESNELKYGYIDMSGKVLTPFQFDEGISFSQGMAAIKRANRWGFINTKGTERISVVYDKVSSFNYGMAHVTYRGIPYYIDQRGNYLADME